MATDAEIDAQIAELEELLNSGATSVSSDGESVQLSHAEIRKRIETLRSQKSGQAHRRRRVRTLNIGKAF